MTRYFIDGKEYEIDKEVGDIITLKKKETKPDMSGGGLTTLGLNTNYSYMSGGGLMTLSFNQETDASTFNLNSINENTLNMTTLNMNTNNQNVIIGGGISYNNSLSHDVFNTFSATSPLKTNIKTSGGSSLQSIFDF